MKPVDFRNETFAEIYERCEGDRLAVLEALKKHGPCTTRQLAAAMEWDILTVRPRVTELAQIGAVEACDAHGHEGVYRARMLGEWMDEVRSRNTRETVGEQMQMQLL